MEITVNKKRNTDGDFTNYNIIIDVDNTAKAKELFTITCPADEEQVVIEQIIKIFGGNCDVDIK